MFVVICYLNAGPMLVDVFGQAFVMLFPSKGWLLSPKKQLELDDDEMDFLVLLEIIVY